MREVETGETKAAPRAQFKNVSFRKMKRKPVISVIAVFVLVIYSVAIVGFDVHTCSHLGRSFVVSLLKGTSCDDIHPESSEHLYGAAACHCHDCEVAAAEEASSTVSEHCFSSSYTDSCCSDACHFLDLTGVDGNDSNRGSLTISALQFVQLHWTLPSSSDSICPDTSALWNFGRRLSAAVGSVHSVIQSLFCIWRI